MPSKGDAVLAPVIPNATPAAFELPVIVIVIVIVPLADHIAYQVSRCLFDENATLTLRVHVRVGLDVTLLTVKASPSTTETYRTSFAVMVVKVMVITLVEVDADAEPSTPKVGPEAEAQRSRIMRLEGIVVALENAGDHK